MKSEKGIANKLEETAYDVVYTVFGMVMTLWDYLFRPSTFKRLSGIARLDEEKEEKVSSPYALPITYGAVSLVAFFLYMPAIVGFQPENFPLLGQALFQRIDFLNSFTKTIQGARLSQIVMMLVPFIVVVGLHAALMRLLLGACGLKTSLDTQLKIDAYAGGTAILLFCAFMSPNLIREPMMVFTLQPDSVSAQVVFIVIVTLFAAAFGLVAFRYMTFVHHSCHASQNQWWRTGAAVAGALILSAVILWLIVVLWFPFLVESGPV